MSPQWSAASARTRAPRGPRGSTRPLPPRTCLTSPTGGVLPGLELLRLVFREALERFRRGFSGLVVRVAQLEGQQQCMEVRLKALETTNVATAWSSVVEMGRKLAEEELSAAHLRVRLEALEEALKRDLVFQNQALVRLEGQVAELQSQLKGGREPAGLELHGLIALEVSKQVRMEYERLVLELLGAQVSCLGAIASEMNVEVEHPWLSMLFPFKKQLLYLFGRLVVGSRCSMEIAMEHMVVVWRQTVKPMSRTVRERKGAAPAASGCSMAAEEPGKRPRMALKV